MDDSIPECIRFFINEHLTDEERRQIDNQFITSLYPNRQVLWSGMPREVAQKWADKNSMQTLTTAMGPLMDRNHRLCPQHHKNSKQWTKYIHGASAIFALHISKGDVVTVLTPPPPTRFHPSGTTSFQVIEEPIIKGRLGNRAVRRIEVAHPTVPEASLTLYQLWPEDQYPTWMSTFGNTTRATKWRQVKPRSKVVTLGPACGTLPDHSLPKTIPGPETSRDNSGKALQQQQSRERQLLQEQEAQRRRSLRRKQRKEMQSLQRRQAAERKSLAKSQRGLALHKREIGEMKELRIIFDQQKADLMNEEKLKMKALKTKHENEKLELQERGRNSEKCKGHREGASQLRRSCPEDKGPPAPDETSTPSVGSSLTTYIYSLVGSALAKVFG